MECELEGIERGNVSRSPAMVCNDAALTELTCQGGVGSISANVIHR
jgi:hypothetical protein